MASSYPGAVDALTNPISTDAMNSVTVPHAAQHANANDAIEAIETELGTDPSGASATVKARLDTLDTTVAGKAPATGIAPAAITGTAVVTADARLSDARTPTAHAAAHASAGGDPVTVAQSQVTSLVTDLGLKSPLASPTFTGTPAAPTAADGTNTTQLATTAHVFSGLAGKLTTPPAWTAGTPAVTAGSGALTSASAVSRHTQMGKVVAFSAIVTITTNGTGASDIRVVLPVNAKSGGYYQGSGREGALTGNQLQVAAVGGTDVCQILNYNNSYPGGTGASLQVTVTYEAA